MMDSNLILVLSFSLSIVTFSLIGKWYVLPALSSLPKVKALTPLLLLHTIRHIGMSFLVPGVVASTLPSAFAHPAAYGDLTASLLALLSVAALRLNLGIAVPLVWIANIEGTLDLLHAVLQGLINGITEKMGATYFIPVVVVPALLVAHFLIFKLLLQQRD